MRAMTAGRITFARFAEIGRVWLDGGSPDDILDELPASIPDRIARYVASNPGKLAREIDAILELPEGRTAEMCARLRSRGLVRTERDGHQIRLFRA